MLSVELPCGEEAEESVEAAEEGDGLLVDRGELGGQISLRWEEAEHVCFEQDVGWRLGL